MVVLIKIIFYLSSFIIFWAMIGYPLLLKLLSRIYSGRIVSKDYSYQPDVSIIICAYNEEKVIKKKLENLIGLEYPKSKTEIIVVSDWSDDKTDDIVDTFIKEHREHNIVFHRTKKRSGKVNATNEGCEIAKGEIIVVTDANSYFKSNALNEITATYISDDIAYVCGQLVYTNHYDSDSAEAENTYWKRECNIREIEGRIQTITTGNGAIFSFRKKEFIEVDPIHSHDSTLPPLYALKKKRAICNNEAIALEKACDDSRDEFKRKIRMNRDILQLIFFDIHIFNIFKYKWFSVFYFGHKTCRYLLWAAHLLLFIASICLMRNSMFYLGCFVFQISFYMVGLISEITPEFRISYLNLVYHYCGTILAQCIGVYNQISGKSKAAWNRPESAR